MFGPPTLEELNLQYTLEFDPNSPRLRLSIVAYLIEGGLLETFEIAEVLGMAEAITSFVTEGSGDFMTAVEAAQIVPDPEQMDSKPENPIEDSGYNYL